MLTTEVIGAIRRAFSRSKFAINFKNSRIIKGVKGPRGGKIVQCDSCKQNSAMYTSEVDHCDPVVPLMISGKVMSFNMLFERTFCDVSNLQILCKICHKQKSKAEMSQRVKWRKLKKYLVCRHSGGSRMEVIGITNLKDLAEYWEVLAVFALKKDADLEMKRRKKL